MFQRILVTGGAGFIGSTLALALQARYPSAQVVALDNLRRRGSELNLLRLHEAGVLFRHGDVRCREDLEALPEPDLILACAAEPSAQAGYGESPDYLFRTNIEGCRLCLELARRNGAAFVLLSSSRVYSADRLNELGFVEDETRFRLTGGQLLPGASEQGVGEGFPLAGQRSLYGTSKLGAELLVQEYGHAYGIPFLIDRCGLVSGPGQMGKADQGVIAFWLAAHYFRRPLSYIGFGGQGKQVRDFLHVQDLCDLVLLQLADFGRFQNRVLNVGGGADFSLSLYECTELCRAITGNTVPIASEPRTRPADVRIYLTDRTFLSGLSGWSPCRDAPRTLCDLFAWLHASEKPLRSVLAAC